MCGKRLLALLLALLAVVCLIRGHAFGQTATRQRPVLIVWGADWCAYCRQFENDLAADSAFRAAVEARYRIVRRDWDRERAAAYLAGVFQIPAFIGQDGRRAIGYTTASDLVWRLRLPHGRLQAPGNPPAGPQPQQPAAPAGDPPAGTSGPDQQPQTTDRLEKLEQLLEQQAGQLERWQTAIGQHLQQRDTEAAEQATAGRKAAEQLQADLAATRAALETLQAKAEETAAGGQVIDLTGPAVRETAGASAVSNTGDNQPAREPAGGGPLNWLQAAALALLRRKAMAEGLAIGGPIGAAVIGGGWLLRRWWRGRSAKPAEPQQQPEQKPAAPGPAWAEGLQPVQRCTVCDQLRQRLDQQQQAATAEQQRLRAELDHTAGRLELATAEGLQTQTRYVRVPVADPEGEAFRESLRRVAGQRPADVGLLNLVEDTARQLLHGQRVRMQTGRPPDAKPGIWSDDSTGKAA